MKMGVIDERSHWTVVGKKVIQNGFPVMSPESLRVTEEMAYLVADSFDNVLLLGRASSGAFLMNEILQHTYDVIEERL